VVISSLDNVSEFWFEGSTTDKESIDIWVGDQISTVCAID